MSLLGGVARGAKRYVSVVWGGAKGAAGWESIHQTGQMMSSAAHRIQLRTCPRCLEQSLEQSGGTVRCTREDICGYQDSVEGAKSMGQGMRMDLRVLALAKGVNADFGKRSAGAVTISRAMWGLSCIIAMYSLYWLVVGSWTSVWTLLVAILCAVHAIRYAYMSQMLSDLERISPMRFLLTPSRWFV
jgi:hypothetical protein